MKVLLSVFHFAHVELTNARYLIMFVDHCRCFTLRLRKNNINEVLEINAYITSFNINNYTWIHSHTYINITFAGGTTAILLKLYIAMAICLPIFTKCEISAQTSPTHVQSG